MRCFGRQQRPERLRGADVDRLMCVGNAADDERGVDTEPNVADDSGEERQRPPQPVASSGAAAAAALAAAKADVAAREHARRTWKDPIAAAREQAASPSAAAASWQPATANGHVTEDKKARAEGGSREGPSAGEEEKSGRGQKQGKGRRKGTEHTANGSGTMTRKRTRSGVLVDCEEI